MGFSFNINIWRQHKLKGAREMTHTKGKWEVELNTTGSFRLFNTLYYIIDCFDNIVTILYEKMKEEGA